MYDRRVVRGNTFAALVIPVNMQPESVTSEKKVKRSSYYPGVRLKYLLETLGKLVAGIRVRALRIVTAEIFEQRPAK